VAVGGGGAPVSSAAVGCTEEWAPEVERRRVDER
jgi:hypothetical protein